MTEDGIVHIVDDDDLVRRALDSLIRSAGFRTGMYSTALEFLSTPRPDVASCVVLDIRLPGISGLETQQQLVQSKVQIPVILMTGYADIPMTVRGMKAGAVDFLTKPFRDDEILSAVSQAIDRDRARRAAEQRRKDVFAAYEALTPREREVMAMVVVGRLNKQIASDLSITEVTVKMHRGSVMKKLKAGSLSDLIRVAEVLGVAPPLQIDHADKSTAKNVS